MLSLILLVSLALLSVVSLFVGVIDLDLSSLFAGNAEQLRILLISRLPRLLAVLCTGVGMSVAGLIMQQLCMNKFVSPTTGATISYAQLGILLLSVVVLAGIVFALRRELTLLDVLTLGKEQAINLGVDYDRCIRRLLLGVTVCIAVATAMVGPISFLGLIIANLSRQLLKTYRHTQLILGSALFGVIVLVGGQLIVEHVYSYAIPVSVFITIGGGVYFLYLLLRTRRT